MRTKALITGAAGGMGRACTRLFAGTHDMVLTDCTADSLNRFADELRDDGYTVVGAHAGDLGSDALLSRLVADLDGDAPFKLIHTAGLAPSQGDWQAIIAINLVTTAKLLRTLEPLLRPGSVAVLIASVAGYAMPAMPEVEAILDTPLASDLIERLAPIMDGFAAEGGAAAPAGASYALSKQTVMRLCEQRAAAWGRRSARIVSISPGLIITPMGRRELANTPAAVETRDAAPMGRPGTPMDIALAARFLCSDDASFITGCDLRVDGGTTAAQRTAPA